MIIRPHCKTGYVSLPNSLFNDRRLSADTRAMLAVLFSKPPAWELRPGPLGRLLSREGERVVGWTRLRRMFAEATAAGYMARSGKQLHNPNGTWGKYEYFVGMPDDVLRAVQKAGVAIAPQPRDPHEGLPHAQNDFTDHKVKSLHKTDSKNENLSSSALPLLGRALKRHSGERGKRTESRVFVGKEVIQNQLAFRVGAGDVERGWLIIGQLPASRLDEMTALERLGRLTELDVENAIALVALAEAKGATP